MKEGYSIKKGLGKALVQLLTVAGTVATVAGFSDATVLDLLMRFWPAAATATVGGGIAFFINFIKYNWS